MRKFSFGLAVCVALLLGPGPALAASGTALGVDPSAEAERPAGTQLLTVGADIFIGDRVVTGATGQVQIRFDDTTELVVGPRSSLVIEDYLLREDGSAGKLALNALAGSFRFVTGGAPKDRYTIRTPTGTIGVRGTAFELYVTALQTYILMQHGVVNACNASDCVVLQARCEVGQVSLGEAVTIGHADTVSGAAREQLRQMFIYVMNQRPLLRQFRIAGAERCLRRPSGGAVPQSLSTTGSGGGVLPTAPPPVETPPTTPEPPTDTPPSPPPPEPEPPPPTDTPPSSPPDDNDDDDDDGGNNGPTGGCAVRIC